MDNLNRHLQDIIPHIQYILQKEPRAIQGNMFIDAYRRSRVSVMNNLGMSSINIRLKAIEVSFLNSLKRIWFGYGAGTSQKLLPKMADEYDKSVDRNSAKYFHMFCDCGIPRKVDAIFILCTNCQASLHSAHSLIRNLIGV